MPKNTKPLLETVAFCLYPPDRVDVHRKKLGITMEQLLTRIRNSLLGDSAPRVLLLGGAVVLTVVVVIDIFGARERAPQVRETMRLVADQAPTATVPTRYNVPRDLASESRMTADDGQTQMAEPVAEDPSMPEQPAEMAQADTAIGDPAGDLPEAEPAAEADAMPEAEAELAEAPQDAMPEPEPATEAEAVTEQAEAPIEGAGDADMGLALLAGADIANGQSVWRQCAACHVFDSQQNRGGPYLVNIIGRDIGAAEGWRYSRALSEHGGVWTVDALLAWLENPDSYIPGNQMAFRGLRDAQDRIDLLGFLNANRVE
jgi:cytochrome c2